MVHSLVALVGFVVILNAVENMPGSMLYHTVPFNSVAASPEQLHHRSRLVACLRSLPDALLRYVQRLLADVLLTVWVSWGAQNISHNVRRFRFALQSDKHKFGLPVGQHVFLYAKYVAHCSIVVAICHSAFYKLARTLYTSSFD